MARPSLWCRGTLLSLLCTILCVPTFLSAAEIDSLSARYSLRRDALGRINSVMNERLAEGVESANEEDDGCDAEALYAELKDAVAQSYFLVGHGIAEQLREDELIPRDHTPLSRSVYQDLAFFTGISMQLADLMGTVRLAGHEVGLDKFGHFFAEGWSYFKIAYLDDEGVAAAMDWGENTERTYFGRFTTGIYSYADLTANFNGMRFWRRVLGDGEDPLGQERAEQLYVACQEDRWVLQSGSTWASTSTQRGTKATTVPNSPPRRTEPVSGLGCRTSRTAICIASPARSVPPSAMRHGKDTLSSRRASYTRPVLQRRRHGRTSWCAGLVTCWAGHGDH